MKPWLGHEVSVAREPRQARPPPATADQWRRARRILPTKGRTLRFILLYAYLDPDAAGIELQFRAGMPGGNATVELQATMAGNTRTLLYPLSSQASEAFGWVNFNPCVHPGGSDLPGTEAEFSVSVVEPGDIVQAGGFDTTSLGPDETKPVVTIDSEPPNRSQVEPGDEIVLDATAEENRQGPTWQEGLNSFKLISEPGGLVGEEQRSDAGSPQPCDSKQWSLTSHATYTVPDDAPAVIKICGEALDFGGNFSDPDACNEYYTGEVWQGPLTGRAVIPGCDPNPVPITGELDAVVAGDGTVTGTVMRGARLVLLSGRPTSGVLDRTNPFTGTKTADAFVLDLYGEMVTLPIIGTQATADADFPGAGGSGVFYTYTLNCVTCGP